MVKKQADLVEHEAYNPLDKRNIGESIVNAMLCLDKQPLPPEPFIGAGVYAIYYEGGNSIYGGLGPDTPIYVGKAVPSGARKGGVGTSENQGTALASRLGEHSDSILQAQDLELADFSCRFLAVDDIWIPLAETLLIERFQPVWNVLVDGFGNHNPGHGRGRQKKSQWDTLHFGRPWANALKPNDLTREELVRRVLEFLKK